jgi:hypothetical protein
MEYSQEDLFAIFDGIDFLTRVDNFNSQHLPPHQDWTLDRCLNWGEEQQILVRVTYENPPRLFLFLEEDEFKTAEQFVDGLNDNEQDAFLFHIDVLCTVSMGL